MLSKIFEKSAKKQITEYFEETGKLYQSQHAYRRYHGTATSLAEIADHLHWEIEQKNIPAVISTDLSKAFDTVSHPPLLSKLEQMGVASRATLWLKSYLSRRTQVTSFPDITSDTCEIESGVPQGSILGPILLSHLLQTWQRQSLIAKSLHMPMMQFCWYQQENLTS